MTMDSQIHIFFIPFLSRGHTIPLIDTARLFAQRGIRCTVVTTAGNSSYIKATIDQANADADVTIPIDLRLVPFPAAESGLPAGVECTDSFPPGDRVRHFFNLYHGMSLLRDPIGKLADELRPNCIVSDSLLFWTTPFAKSRSIPLFHFSVFSPFSKAVFETIFTTGAHLSSADSAAIGPLTGLPHQIELTRTELPLHLLDPQGRSLKATKLAEDGIAGIIFNSFDELAPEYNEHCRKQTLNGTPMSVFCIGPVQLYKSIADDKWGGCAETKIWLDSKKPESVLYVGFGSECSFSSDQLREIATGLQNCRHSFIWVVRRGGGGGDNMDDWLPEHYFDNVGDRGLILTEWVPQMAIMSHIAIGGCIVHCGWNSCVETMCAGRPVVAWPLHYEQFVNERFMVEVLKLGVRILKGPGMRSEEPTGKGTVKAAVISDAVDRLMGAEDEETREMRVRAKKYQKMARAAMEEGGSSYVNLSRVIEKMSELVKEIK